MNKIYEISHLVALDREISWQDGKWAYCAVIITDLATDPYHLEYDAQALNNLVAQVAQYLNSQNQGFHSLILRSHQSFSVRNQQSKVAE